MPAPGSPQQQVAQAKARQLTKEDELRNGPDWTGTYDITYGKAFRAGQVSGYGWQEAQSMLASADPAAISQAGQACNKLSQTHARVTGKLASYASTIAASWQGPSAASVVSQIQQLHQTASDLSANSWSAATTLSWFGQDVLPACQQQLPLPSDYAPQEGALGQLIQGGAIGVAVGAYRSQEASHNARRGTRPIRRAAPWSVLPAAQPYGPPPGQYGSQPGPYGPPPGQYGSQPGPYGSPPGWYDAPPGPPGSPGTGQGS